MSGVLRIKVTKQIVDDILNSGIHHKDFEPLIKDIKNDLRHLPDYIEELISYAYELGVNDGYSNRKESESEIEED